MTTISTRLADSDSEHDHVIRQRYPVWLECQQHAVRALGVALVEVASLFNELDDVYPNSENFEEEREEAKQLISEALGLVARCSEGAFRYAYYRCPELKELPYSEKRAPVAS